MQPYWFPYLGYFQLMNAVDEFVVYDNVQYTKKGWINRNRILGDAGIEQITVPLKHDSHTAEIRGKELADNWPKYRTRLLNRIKAYYAKAPHFDEAYSTVEKCLSTEEVNLFNFLLHSLEHLKIFLGIKTPLIVSSSVPVDHSLKSQAKVLEICRALQSQVYINPQGGVALYSKSDFQARGIELKFMAPEIRSYPQFGESFVPALSIIDAMMFNDTASLKDLIETSYKIV